MHWHIRLIEAPEEATTVKVVGLHRKSPCETPSNQSDACPVCGAFTYSEDRSSGADSDEYADQEQRRWYSVLKGLFRNLTREQQALSASTPLFSVFRSSTMTKETFLQLFPQLPGVVGERLFAAFDTDKNGTIDFQEFIKGLAALSSADWGEKLKFIFMMYDLNGDGQLSRDELGMMLYYIPASYHFLSRANRQSIRRRSDVLLSDSSGDLLRMKSGDILAEDAVRSRRRVKTLAPTLNTERKDSLRTILQKKISINGHWRPASTEEFDEFIDALVDQAFCIYEQTTCSKHPRGCPPACALRNVPQMEYSKFCEAVVRYPELRAALELFTDETINPRRFLPVPQIPTTKPQRSMIKSFTSAPSEKMNATCPNCGAYYDKSDMQMLPCFQGSKEAVSMSGWLEKEGRVISRRFVRRFCILKGRFIFWYRSPMCRTPMKATMLANCEVLSKASERDRFPFEIKRSKSERQTFYAPTKKERDLWVDHLSKATGLREFHDVYLLEERLGAGKFGTVFSAVRRATGEKVAVKLLARPQASSATSKAILGHLWSKRLQRKDSEDDGESLKEFQRNEVAVLRLLNHPNLIKLYDVFSTTEFVYIVMEWNPSGDVRRILDIVQLVNETWISAGCLLRLWIPEPIARMIVRGLAHGLTFLHSPKRNIIHRDLKPENILVKYELAPIIRLMHSCWPDLPGLTNIASRRIRLTADEPLPTPHSSTEEEKSVEGSSKSHQIEDVKKHDAVATNTNSSESHGEDLETSSVDTVDLYSPKARRDDQFSCVSDCDLQRDGTEITAIEDQERTARDIVNLWIFLHCIQWEGESVPPFVSSTTAVTSLERTIDELQSTTPQTMGRVKEIYRSGCFRNALEAKITDFGLSKIVGPPSDAMSAPHGMTEYADEVLGTCAYAAPEVLEGSKYTTSADIWSLGVVTYQLLSGGRLPTYQNGRPLFSPKEEWSRMSSEARKFVMLTLTRDPRNRVSAQKAVQDDWLRLE